VDFSNVLREQAHLTGNFLVDRESLAYMSPERYHGRPRTSLTDQYSLGLIARELLGGQQVPRVVCPADLRVKSELFSDLESGTGEWTQRSPELAGIISRMLRTDPQARWPSMRDVRHFLREVEVAESPEERYRRVAKFSYLRLQSRGLDGQRTFFARFYERLFEACPDVRPHFESIDMERQYQILNGAIHVLLDCRPASTSGSEALRNLAAKHGRLGLTERHYHAFVDSLVATVEELVDKDPDNLVAWRATLQPAVDAMARADVEGPVGT
jgi:hemoglobin-like flavoprotein